MIGKYIAERKGWIAFFLFVHLLLLFIGYVDQALPFRPVMYITFLSLLLFLIFLVIRYKKETKYYQALSDWADPLDLSSLPEPGSPYERMIDRTVQEQAETLKKEIDENRLSLQLERDGMLSWIHEMKTPLTAMNLMIERIPDDSLKSGLTYEWLRVHLLLDQQLHQQRIPMIENDLFAEKTELEPILFEEIKTLKSWCLQKQIGFDIDLAETVVLSDGKWLSFIIRQVLTNAVKYSRGSDIQIRSYRLNGHTLLEIEDYGRGIAERDLPRIFDRGFTSTSHHKDQAATGMGLYLAKKAADALHIQIHADSEYGKGTTISLTFPTANEFVRITGM